MVMTEPTPDPDAALADRLASLSAFAEEVNAATARPDRLPGYPREARVQVGVSPALMRSVEATAVRAAVNAIVEAVTLALAWGSSRQSAASWALAALRAPDATTTLATRCPLCNGPACGPDCPLRAVRGALATLDTDLVADGADLTTAPATTAARDTAAAAAAGRAPCVPGTVPSETVEPFTFLGPAADDNGGWRLAVTAPGTDGATHCQQFAIAAAPDPAAAARVARDTTAVRALFRSLARSLQERMRGAGVWPPDAATLP